jgi:hypothetical protein
MRPTSGYKTPTALYILIVLQYKHFTIIPGNTQHQINTNKKGTFANALFVFFMMINYQPPVTNLAISL